MNLFIALQESVADQLKSTNEFLQREGLEILTEKKGDILSMIEVQLQKLGLGITVITPTFAKGEIQFHVQTQVLVIICENITNNQSETGTRIPAMDVALAVVGTLWGWTPDGGWHYLEFEDCKFAATPWQGTISYEVSFSTGTKVDVQEGPRVETIENT